VSAYFLFQFVDARGPGATAGDRDQAERKTAAASDGEDRPEQLAQEVHED
jgi:hypothetical protein